MKLVVAEGRIVVTKPIAGRHITAAGPGAIASIATARWFKARVTSSEAATSSGAVEPSEAVGSLKAAGLPRAIGSEAVG